MITIFSTSKAFTHSHLGITQRNAINSWALLRPAVEIILFGDDPGVASIAREFGARHVSKVKMNAFGTPLISDMFLQAQAMAQFDTVAYVASDIILMDDFLESVARISAPKFLITGRRTDLDVTSPIDFSADWQKRLSILAGKNGKLHGPSAIDYVVFPRGFFSDMPPFAIARTAFDNWLLYYAWANRFPLIDATDSILAVHQNHDYSHHAKGVAGCWRGPECNENVRLAGGLRHLFKVSDADWLLTKEGLRRPGPSFYRILSYSFRHYDRHPIARPLLFPGWVTVIFLRAIRRHLSHI